MSVCALVAVPHTSVLVSQVEGEAPPKADLPPPPPTEEDVAAAEQAVEAQAVAVRELKDGKGLTNTSPEVQAAVAELKARKDHVADVKRRFEEANKDDGSDDMGAFDDEDGDDDD